MAGKRGRVVGPHQRMHEQGDFETKMTGRTGKIFFKQGRGLVDMENFIGRDIPPMMCGVCEELQLTLCIALAGAGSSGCLPLHA